MDIRTRLRPFLIAAGLAAIPVGSYAAGMGNLTVLSPLGQQLQAELNITATPEELASLSVRLASVETFRQAGVEYVPTLSSLRFSVEKRANGQPYVRVTSSQTVNEPFLDLLVELNWAQGRLVREYTFLLDPPEALQKAPAAAVAAPEVKVAPAVPAQVAPAPVAPAQAAPAPAPVAEKKIPVERVAKPASPAKPPAETKPAESATKVAATNSAATNAADRLVKRGDTLSKIAVETRPEGASLDQMLLALFNSNKAAFDADNMHRLRAGKILSIPDAQTVGAVDPGEARKTISAQAADFNAYRQKLAAVASAKPTKKEEASQQAAIGKITPKVEDKVPAPAGKDKLQVSKTAAAKDVKPGGTANRGSAAEEDLVAKDKSLKEAKSRITELEKNVGEMKKLAELKSQNLAELQKQAQATGKPGSLPAPTPSAVPVPAVKPAPPPVAAAAAPAVVATAKPVVEAPKPVEPPKPAEAVAEKPLEVAKPAEPVEKKPVPIEQKRTEPATAKPAVVAPPAQAPDFIDENPELVYGGGGIVALLLGYLGYSAMRRRGEKGESSPQSQPSEEGLTANSVFGMTGGRSVDTSNSSIQTDFSQSGMGSIDTDEGVDPVAEADVYMAYGRDAQAEEILVDALKTDPHRLAIHLKLLEIYAGRNSVQQFEALAGEVFALTAGSGVEWDKATALGRGIDPDNPLYALKVSGDDVIESTTEAPSPVDASTGSQGTATRGLAAEPLNVTRVAQTQPETPAEPQPDQSPAALDFDLDLGAQTQPGEDFGLPAASAVDFDLGVEIAGHPVSEPVGGQSLEFRPNFEETTDTSNTLTSPPVSSVKPEVAAATEALSTETIDFDLALPVGDESFDAVVAGDGGKPLDFDFDLELPSSTPLPELAAVPAAAPMPATLPDQSEVLTDFAAQVERTAGNDDNASLDETTRQEVATKLELAQAYEEMGDSEGARELLQEVLEEGDQAQRDAARNRLALLV